MGIPAIPYGCKIWDSQSQRKLQVDARKLQGFQIALLRKAFSPVPVGIPSAAVLAEVTENPCCLKWWLHLVHFVAWVSGMPRRSLQRYAVSKGNITEALRYQQGNITEAVFT